MRKLKKRVIYDRKNVVGDIVEWHAMNYPRKEMDHFSAPYATKFCLAERFFLLFFFSESTHVAANA